MAGRTGLEMQVARAHVGGIADIARFLAGGELLLTAGQGMGEDAASRRAFVMSLAGAGVAALLLETAGRVFADMPEDVVAVCDEQGLPLLRVQGEISFEAVSEELRDRLRDARTRNLEQAERVSSDLVRVLVDRHDLEPALASLAELTAAHVVLEQAGGAVRWSAPPGLERDETGDGPTLLTADGCPVCRTDDHRPAGSTPTGAPMCTRAELSASGRSSGVLHVVTDHRTRVPVPQLVVDRAAGLIALLLAADSADMLRTDRELSKAVTSMLDDPALDAANRRRLMMLAPALSGSRVLVLVLPPPSTAMAAQQLSRSAGPGTVVIDQDARTVVLVRESSAASTRGRASELAGAWRRDGLLRSAVGAASGDVGELPAVVRAAVLAGDVARRRKADEDVIFVEDVPLERLLAPLVRDGSLAAYRRDVLGPVLEHDRGSRAPLLPTLQALVQAAGNRSAAAAYLNVERRTVQAHVTRLERLLGAPLEEPAMWLRLSLAVVAPTLSAASEPSRDGALVRRRNR